MAEQATKGGRMGDLRGERIAFLAEIEGFRT